MGTYLKEFESFETKTKENLVTYLKGIMPQADIIEGVDAFEKFLNIETDIGCFERDYMKNIEAFIGDLLGGEIGDANNIEHFLKKVSRIKGGTGTKGLSGLFGEIGFYTWANHRDVEQYRANDSLNNQLVNGRYPTDFHLSTKVGPNYINLDVEAYEEANKKRHNYLYSYMQAYILRNNKSHIKADAERLKHVFVVYIHQCLVNKDKIEELFVRQLLSKIEYTKYADDCLEETHNFKEHTFVQLKWVGENGKKIDFDAHPCLKFVGEAGFGKTTQMKELYKTELESQKKTLPIWIELSKFNNWNDTIIAAIDEKLQDLASWRDVLLKEGVISLYLDGFNEFIADTPEKRERKKQIAADIDELHKNSKLRIYMTNRDHNKSGQHCLDTNVKVCHFEGMIVEEMKEYCRSYLATQESKLKVMENYFELPYSEWIREDENVIPEKLNMLIEIFKKEDSIINLPKDPRAFYEQFLESLLYREASKKKDSERVNLLKLACKKLALEMQSPDESWLREEIEMFWAGESSASIEKSREAIALMDLAIGLPILAQGEVKDSWKFKYKEYYFYFKRTLRPRKNNE